jgi:hypothetical protein
MAELRLTRARLKVLQAVADGDVWQRYSWVVDGQYVNDWLGRRVNARCAEMERVGWIRLLPREPDAHNRAARRWQITPAGRFVLDHGDIHVVG